MTARFRPRSHADDDQAATELLEAIRPDDWDGTTVVFGGAAVVGLPPGEVYRQAAPAPLRAQPPPPGHSVNPCACCRHDDDTIARDLGRGWQHLFELRCAYPAAASDTPIPCGSVHRDPTARSLRGLRHSAWTAGWGLDALGRWACPGCCQASPEFRTLYPVTVWDPEAADAAQAGDRRGEFWARAAAEHDLFRSVRDAAAKHAGSPR